jgi:beta-phosphoglucomutase-like phosphatase (HAD superfamily)
MPQAVIFDVDGTIVDSVDLHAEAWRVAFKKFGKAFPFSRDPPPRRRPRDSRRCQPNSRGSASI